MNENYSLRLFQLSFDLVPGPRLNTKQETRSRKKPLKNYRFGALKVIFVNENFMMFVNGGFL
jgi:hypothetical protein